VLETATIVKMAQNVIIGSACVVFTFLFQDSLDLMILIDKFPLFVVGFFITSAIATTIQYTQDSSEVASLVISNSWMISEWSNLLGFVIIGFSIDIRAFWASRHDKSIVLSYAAIQAIDVSTTLAWAYLAFRNSNYDEDDDESR
jgi:uncharacterized membrane protein YadS